MSWFQRTLELYKLQRYAIPDPLWRQTTHKLPVLHWLSASQKARLRVLATLFIHKKTFTGVQEFVVTDEIKIIIAAQACLEILELGIDAFDGWVEIVIYPAAFRVERETQDEIGLIHNESNALSGESWMQGPVILSWEDVQADSFQIHRGHQVVIHEFAHKLDMLNGRANGMPPLHPDMHIEDWTKSLSQAYENLVRRVEHHHGRINPYAATNPAEFFAVICEYFFTAPDLLIKEYPAVYHQLKAYFRLDPLT